ncbi:MAG: TonB-dependent receptor [Rhizobiaceae bacterium]|nr:TonB-dependent receptor [Rhizobiaceae bacterium]
MTSNSTRALALGTALGLLALHGAAFAQSNEPERGAAAEETPAVSRNGVIVLDQIDVGAGAAGTAGTDVIAVDKEELDRRKPGNLREIFAGEPQVQVGGSIPMTQKLYVNGVEETNLAITVDGSRQNNKVFHHNGNFLIDPALLKAVTVSAGVAPADAGPGALGGSLGFETVDAADLLEQGRNFGGFVTGTWDSNSNTFTTGLSGYGRGDGFEFLGYINYADGGNFTAGSGVEMPGTGIDLLSGLGKVAYESVEGHRFELSHEHLRDDDPRPYRANFYFNRPGEPETREYDLTRQNTVFTYADTSPEGWWDPKVVIAYSATKLDTDFIRFAVTAPSIGETASFNGKVENRFALELGSVTAGFDFYRDEAKFEYVHPADGYVSDEKASNVGIYAQARLEPSERARLSFGGRADHQWFTGTDGSDWTNAGVSGNLSGEYDIVPDVLTAKAGASRVWGGVALAENFIQNPNWNYGDGPAPVTSNNLTAGLEARFNGFSLEANVFRTDIDDARLPVYGGATPGATSLATHDLQTRGWEIGGRYDWDVGFVSIKYADVTADLDGYYPDSDIGRYLTTPLGQSVMIGAGYTFVDYGLRVGGDMEIAFRNKDTTFVRPEYADAKLALPGYQVVNAFAEWTPPSKPNFTLRADAKNIFDENYTNRASYGQDFDGTKPHFDPGRSFRLSATLRF